jgi:hypothetical protein
MSVQYGSLVLEEATKFDQVNSGQLSSLDIQPKESAVVTQLKDLNPHRISTYHAILKKAAQQLKMQLKISRSFRIVWVLKLTLRKLLENSRKLQLQPKMGSEMVKISKKCRYYCGTTEHISYRRN